MSIDRSATGRPSRVNFATSIARVCVVTSVFVVVFVRAPLNHAPSGDVAVELVVSLVVLAMVIFYQIMAVARSPFPGLRAAETVAISVPLLILLFASAYFVMAQTDSGSFSEPLSRPDAVYFTVTVLATVGFGDIAAQTEPARIVVTVQMIANMVLIGVIARVLLGTVRQRRAALDSSSSSS